MSAVVEPLWSYLLVFLMAATPWVELLVVIPLGVAMGLSPYGVALVALLGNALPVVLIAVGWRTWQRWRGQPRRALKPRVQRVWNRWGLPGLALLGPLVTGIHLATVAALALRSSTRATAAWMVGSLVVWTLATTLVTVGGVAFYQRMTLW
ncbi:small multi-drug export protein [Alkalilimnicola ehrlichii MLHE-1]|uniref:Small multidrug efflux protein-like protein n=1 Tax=Alkalilimnicola ehrlichii (strain ATCC BAA-1101 / DSM 17681 / MLHE-1) TaxID=187272 RepID=Q0A946_ALKEH|nr:small multi-drug export protein [Alkalilimnicola ehrlichii]ABI56641.1 conserved hypothetical protein [Alkalilimnicola ehrlichii MLHE-1]